MVYLDDFHQAYRGIEFCDNLFTFNMGSSIDAQNGSNVFPEGSRGWSGGAMVLGKLPVPGRPTILCLQ